MYLHHRRTWGDRAGPGPPLSIKYRCCNSGRPGRRPVRREVWITPRLKIYETNLGVRIMSASKSDDSKGFTNEGAAPQTKEGQVTSGRVEYLAAVRPGAGLH